MKRFLKILLITLFSLILFFILSFSILMWVIFTPEKLTPLLRTQVEKIVPYPSEFGEVELTFYSTFPDFGIRVKNIVVISKTDSFPSDTLLRLNEVVGAVDVRALWKNNELIVHKLSLSDGKMNIFTDSLGHSNYDLFLTGSEVEPDDAPGSGFNLINLGSIELKNLNISYTDIAAKLTTSFTGLKAKISGDLRGNQVNGHIDLNSAIVSLNYAGEKYLDEAQVRLDIPVEFNIPRQLVNLKKAFASVNGSGITINGPVENDTAFSRLIMDLNFETQALQINNILALIPPVFLSEYGSFDAKGVVSSFGNITGVLSDSLMPVLDINFALDKGYLLYDDLPFPLREMNGIFHVYVDMNNNPDSYINISRFEASTPRSVLKTSGKINELFSDIHLKLVSEADVEVDEFRSFIPADMDLSINGSIKGKLVSDFTISQANDLALEKMKISGFASLSGFFLEYDSISLKTSSSAIEFALPNPETSGKNTSFAFVTVASENLDVSKPGDFSTSIKNSHIYVEMSDVRDTSLIPDIFCTYSMDSITAGMDSQHFAISKPLGYFNISPVPGVPLQPEIQMGYTSYKLGAKMGQDSAVIDDITIHSNIIYDQSQEDIFLQWLANGALGMRNGRVYMPALSGSVYIPEIKMEFNPENFHIHEGSIIIDQSDFELTGSLTNVLSYFRGDSILRGDFSFQSKNTDLAHIMSLTSGIGTEADTANLNPSQQNAADTVSGPYMVPKGIDVLLKADVKKACMGPDTISNIIGDIRVNDGILLLDGLTFTTPAADMQLTAMYRTPRKNHLYLGLDYHMFDVEISRLLQMIPDIDTLMPMLRSFKGSGEFHIAVETYLDSMYNVKKSTLRGASSIKGEDLVLMDGETFSEIARSLRFSKKAENRVDSLSAEFTIFREEIDVYPFLIVMDRYKAVVAGRHNFDLSFDYHISLVESFLPIRLGVDIAGNADDMKYRLASPRYAEFYRPSSRRAVESRQLELRKMIREALLENVKK